IPHLCCGHDALWQGDADTFARLKERNSEVIRASGVETIVTECAECFRTLSRDYDLEGVTVQHISQYIGARKLPSFVSAGSGLRVAYHDPCRLGRHMEVYDEPRELIRSMPGVNLVELEENRERAQCCGVAAMMNCDQASRQLRKRRLDQVTASGAEVLVTTCPKCIAHMVCLQDEGGYDTFTIMDLTQFMAGLLAPRDPDVGDGRGGGRG
ncbi:MAG: hypothetical protein GQ558_04020, partial [Thermoplasmata archaeon]|nr:hypothetical protein [Thermoplasmata archaeon]